MPFYLPGRLDIFPHPLCADQDGLLAFSNNLDADTLLFTYQFGIFPWHHEDEPVMWWFTHPRFVQYPPKLNISKSMRRFINKSKWKVTFDDAFEEVISNCKTIERTRQDSTWITKDLKNAFIDLHNQGFAHSVEIWENDELVGGLYGLSLGKIFFGESMFSKKSNASKMAFVKLNQFLEKESYSLVDCQQETDHLKQFGAELIPSKNFLNALRNNIFVPHKPGKWQYDPLL